MSRQVLRDSGWNGVACLRAHETILYLEVYDLSLVQRTIAFCFDRRVKDKQILPAIPGCDKAVTLCVVESLDDAFLLHGMTPTRQFQEAGNLEWNY